MHLIITSVDGSTRTHDASRAAARKIAAAAVRDVRTLEVLVFDAAPLWVIDLATHPSLRAVWKRAAGWLTRDDVSAPDSGEDAAPAEASNPAAPSTPTPVAFAAVRAGARPPSSVYTRGPRRVLRLLAARGDEEAAKAWVREAQRSGNVVDLDAALEAWRVAHWRDRRAA